VKKTSLNQKHIDLGAKMLEFAGFEMPISYSNIKEEHLAVRNKAGLFDVSHMGEFLVDGPESLTLLQKVLTNNVTKLKNGGVQYSCIPNENGGIVDDLLVYRLSKTQYMLVVNASNIQKDFDWISKNNQFDCTLTDVSDKTELLALQGPKSLEILEKICSLDLVKLEYYHFTTGTVAGIENVLISATGYTGAGGFELYVKPEDTTHIWEAILSAGKELGIKPVGLAARDTLRLEKGFCLYGNDIDDSTSPIAAGLGWIVSLEKDFIGKNFIAKDKKEKTSRRLVGFEMIGRGIPRKDYLVVDEKGDEIGVVTSGTQSPSLEKAIGMAYIDRAKSKRGSEIFIAVRNKKIEAKIVKVPFL